MERITEILKGCKPVKQILTGLKFQPLKQKKSCFRCGSEGRKYSAFYWKNAMCGRIQKGICQNCVSQLKKMDIKEAFEILHTEFYIESISCK